MPQCAPLQELETKIAQTWGEDFVAQGTTRSPNGALLALRLYIDPKQKTWTILFVGEDKSACVAATGRDWQEGEGT